MVYLTSAQVSSDGTLSVKSDAVVPYQPTNFVLKVSAMDSGGLVSAVESVEVSMEHVNHPPEIMSQSFSAPELAPSTLSTSSSAASSSSLCGVLSSSAGFSAGQLVATDPDHCSGFIEEDLKFECVDCGPLFSVTSSGHIRVKSGQALDFESANSHTLSIRVTDKWGGSSTNTVVVTVTDQNDLPIWTVPAMGSAALSIPEDAASANAWSLLLTASDQDGDTLLFGIEPSSGSGTGCPFHFADTASSELTKLTDAVLDFESVQLYTCVVSVQDGVSTDKVLLSLDLKVADVNEVVAFLVPLSPL